jgi:hypothetical protein
MRQRRRCWRQRRTVSLVRSGFDGQRAVEDGEANDFGAGDVRSVALAAGREEEGAVMVGDAGFLPFAGKDVGGFVGVRVDVGRDGDAGGEFAEKGEAAGGLVFVEDEQFNAGIRAGLPGFVFLQSDVRKHGPIQGRRGNIATIIRTR